MADQGQAKEQHARRDVWLQDNDTRDYIVDFLFTHGRRVCLRDDEDDDRGCSVIVERGHKTIFDAIVALRDHSGKDVRLTRGEVIDFHRYLDSDTKIELLVAAGIRTEGDIIRAHDEASRRVGGIPTVDSVYANAACPVTAPPVRPVQPPTRVARRVHAAHGIRRARRPNRAASAACASPADSLGSTPAGDAPSSPHDALAGEAVRP